MSPWTASMRWVHPRGIPVLTNRGAADTAAPTALQRPLLPAARRSFQGHAEEAASPSRSLPVERAWPPASPPSAEAQQACGDGWPGC